MSDPRVLTPEPADAWHRFETHLQLHNTREGKSYKKWLFARAGNAPTLDAVQGGATLLMREVVREYLRREFSGRNMVALDMPLESAEGGQIPSLHELLPSDIDTASDVERRDLESLAASAAVTALSTLQRREKVAILAREIGLSLNHPAVSIAAGCRRSVLWTADQEVLVGLVNLVRRLHMQEDRATLARLAVLVYENIRKLIFPWGKSDSACSQLFMIVENQSDAAQ